MTPETEALLRAPFPYFGGKRRVGSIVWEAFGPDVANYVEPFCGSCAVLLARPGGPGKIETVNDFDRMIANFWRAVQAEPDAVAMYADHPVNEADLHARHKWLVNQAEFRERMHTDPDYYDAKIAGWWVWGICQWIGGGWCVEPNNGKHPKLDGIGKGVHSQRGHREKQRSHMSGDNAGMGVHARTRGADRSSEAGRPDLAGAGKGINSGRGRRGSEADHRKRPELDGTSPGRGVHSDSAHLEAAAYSPGRRPDLNGVSAGQGVHSGGLFTSRLKQQMPALAVGTDGGVGSGGRGVHGLPGLGNDRGLNGVSAAPCVEWFRVLQERLRRVRVACGDWKRVLGPSVLGKGKNVGGRRPCAVFLDPPYSFDLRDAYLYTEDSATISADVRAWALEHGDDPDLRIALCGYEGEHEMPPSWRVVEWKAARGYAKESNENRKKERIWFSPHCLKPKQMEQLSLL